MDILNAQHKPYFNNIDLTRAYDGEWFASLARMSFSGQLELTGGLVATGELYAEYTADPAKQKGIARVLLPAASLHTLVTTITLPAAPIQKVDVASAVTGSAFALMLSAGPVGFMRWRWLPSVIPAAGTHRFTMHGQGERA
jgi:hypothetical protein